MSVYTEKDVFNYLLEKECCKCCSLRYLCNRKIDFTDVDSYIDKNDLLETAAKNEEPNIKKFKSNTCSVCLGLLQDSGIEEILNKINTVQADIQNYDSKVFTCSISMPPCILMREHSMRLDLENKYASFFDDLAFSDSRDQYLTANGGVQEIAINKVWKCVVKDKLAKAVNKTFENSDICDFSINIIMEYTDDKMELEALISMQPEIFKTRQTQRRKYNKELYTRKSIIDVLSRTKPSQFKLYTSVPPKVPDKQVTCKSIECKHNSVYIAGRYCKYSRELSQSPWIIDGVKMAESSVQEIIFEELGKCFSIPIGNLKFAASGREDCDVRCVGKGRPFYIEILDPKITCFKFEDFRKLEVNVNKSALITIKDMQSVPRSDLVKIKEGEETKTKDYTALCIMEEPVTEVLINKINSCGSLNIKQKTPIRVLHRRPLAVRSRQIHKVQAELLPEKANAFVLHLVTQAGTYVKEFVHGDFGRTKPNLREITGFSIDILALDVNSINLQWPPEISEQQT